MIIEVIIKYPNENYYDKVKIYISNSGGGSITLKLSPDGALHLTFDEFLKKIYNKYCIIENEREFISFMFNEFLLLFRH